MDHVDGRDMLEQRAAEVMGAANTARAVAELARCGFGRGSHVLDGLERRLAAHHQDQRPTLDQQDRHQVVDRVEAQFLEQGLVDGQRCEVAHAHGVAVGLGAGDRVGADVAAASRLVVDDHVLAQDGLHQLGHLARTVVGAAACGIRADPGDQLGWIFLLGAAQCGEQQRAASSADQGATQHVLKSLGT